MGSFQVECARGTDGARVPVRVGRPGSMQRVVRVLDRWPGVGHCYFRVRTERDDVLILRHDEDREIWQLVFYERG